MLTQRGPNFHRGFPGANGAEFSLDRTHRYLLWRIWDAATPPLGFVMLNPSSADETRDDPTTVRNMARARALGYGGVVQGNLYSFRTPSPKALKGAGFPGGPDDPRFINMYHVGVLFAACPDVVLAWGAHARAVDAARFVGIVRHAPTPRRLLCLGRLKNGAPRHPLHTAYAVPLQEWK